MSALWWGLFLKRRTLLQAVTPGARTAAPQGLRPRIAGRLSATKLATDAYRSHRAKREMASGDQPRVPRPDTSEGSPPATLRRPSPSDRLAEMCLERDGQPGRGDLSGLARQAILRGERQLDRIRAGREVAVRAGHRRRAARLQVREDRVRADIEGHQSTLRRLGADGPRLGGGERRERRLRAWSQYLDQQAALPRGLLAGGRDYQALSGLAGLGRGEYDRLDRGAQRAARHEIDRALAARREAAEPLEQARGGAAGRPGGGAARPGREDARTPPPRRGRPQTPSGAAGTRPAWEESEVINDIREVAAGRKRQLGIGRP